MFQNNAVTCLQNELFTQNRRLRLFRKAFFGLFDVVLP